MVLDNRVISAPVPQVALCAGQVGITGGSGNPFTAASAKVLADQLKFGALPLPLKLQSEKQLSAFE